MNKKLLFTALFSVVALGAAHLFAMYFYLYWTTWWFDNVAHFLGGLASALVSFWVVRRFFLTRTMTLGGILLSLIALVLIVGVGWEAFEYMLGISDPSRGESYTFDTLYDLIADTLGAVVASLIVYKKELHV